MTKKEFEERILSGKCPENILMATCEYICVNGLNRDLYNSSMVGKDIKSGLSDALDVIYTIKCREERESIRPLMLLLYKEYVISERLYEEL